MTILKQIVRIAAGLKLVKEIIMKSVECTNELTPQLSSEISSEILLGVQKEPQRSLNISIVEGSFCAVHVAIASSALVTGYALMLGANDFHLGLLSALAALGTIGSIIGAELTGFLKKRKFLTIISNVTGRGMWGLFCILPFTSLLKQQQLYLFLTIALISYTLVHTATNSWLSWMTDLVPQEIRGRYFAMRNTIIGIVTMITIYMASHAFDYLKLKYTEQIGFSIVFGIAALSVVISGLIVSTQWEPPLREETTLPLLELIKKPFSCAKLKKLLIFTLAWNFAIGIAIPFWALYMIRHLNMSYGLISIYPIISGVVTLAAQPFCGRLIDKFGSKPILAFSWGGITFLPLIWLFATPGFIWPIWVDAFFTGILWPAFSLASFTILIETMPKENRTSSFAINAIITGAALFVSSALSGYLAESIKTMQFDFGGIQFISFHVIFILSTCARLLLWPLIKKL